MLHGRDRSSARFCATDRAEAAARRLGPWKIDQLVPPHPNGAAGSCGATTRGFSQRFEGRVGQDRTTITAHWEKSSDGAPWEHDFDINYTRL